MKKKIELYFQMKTTAIIVFCFLGLFNGVITQSFSALLGTFIIGMIGTGRWVER